MASKQARQPDSEALNTSAPGNRAAAIDLGDADSEGVVAVHPGATLYVGSQGDVNVIPFRGDGTPVLCKAVFGPSLPLRVRGIVVEDTSADDIVALW